MESKCRFNICGLCKYNGGLNQQFIPTNIVGECAETSDNPCIAFELAEDEPKLTPTSEPMMMSFPIGGNDDMLDLISILNEVMYRFDHVNKTELKAVVSWFKTRYGGE